MTGGSNEFVFTCVGSAIQKELQAQFVVNFFEFYGRKLNIWDVGVSCKASGTNFLKKKRGFLNGDRPYLLSIEDPQAPENDIGKNSFNYSQVRSAFGMAFSTLTSPNTILNLGQNRSILGTIIRPDPILLERKGGVNGEMTFKSLLPGAGEPLRLQIGNDDEVVGNWQFEEEEPFPRETGGPLEEDRSHSSKKRKKRASKSNGDVDGAQTDAGDVKLTRKERKLQKRLKRVEGTISRFKGSNGGSGHYVSGSPWGRSR